MATIDFVTVEAADTMAAERFYATAFDVGDRVRVRAAAEPTAGSGGFTLSLVVSRPADVDSLLRSAVDAGATTLKPAKKSLWGYGSRYVELDTGPVKLTLTLNKPRALAKVAGVPVDGAGSHRLTIGSDAGPFTDPDGYVWEAASS